MGRERWVILLATAVAIMATGVAYSTIREGDEEVGPRAIPATTATLPTTAPPTTATAAPTETTTTVLPTTTTTTSTIAPATTTTSPAPPPAPLLRRGDEGPEVAALQRRLAELHLDPGAPDGRFGTATLHAVEAFQKLNGQAPDGVVGPLVHAALAAPATPTPLRPDGGAERVEIDLVRQLLFVYDADQLRLVSHISTGTGERYCSDSGRCGTARTPTGDHRFLRRIDGWRTSHLGRLYNPIYFTDYGIAVHGATSVPTTPASHGCVRIPMHIAEYFPDLVADGDPVFVV